MRGEKKLPAGEGLGWDKKFQIWLWKICHKISPKLSGFTHFYVQNCNFSKKNRRCKFRNLNNLYVGSSKAYVCRVWEKLGEECFNFWSITTQHHAFSLNFTFLPLFLPNPFPSKRLHCQSGIQPTLRHTCVWGRGAGGRKQYPPPPLALEVDQTTFTKSLLLIQVRLPKLRLSRLKIVGLPPPPLKAAFSHMYALIGKFNTCLNTTPPIACRYRRAAIVEWGG